MSDRQQQQQQQQQQQHQHQDEAHQSLEPDRRRSPNRNIPRSLTPNFFAKPKKSDPPMPSPQPPGAVKSSSKKKERRGSSSTTENRPSDFLAAPEVGDGGMPPKSPTSSQAGGPKGKPGKSGSSGALNNHYRTISRSVNDIFQRGGTREPSPRPSPQDTRRPGDNSRHANEPPDAGANSGNGTSTGGGSGVSGSGSGLGGSGSGSSGGGANSSSNSSVPPAPQISVSREGMGSNGKGDILREGWVNVIDSSYKKSSNKDSWKLMHASLTGDHLHLFKPLNLQVKSFDVTVPSSTVPRPKTAPATGPATQDAPVPLIKHKALSRHPELVINEEGKVTSGSVEAICHEIMFGPDMMFCDSMMLTLPAWSVPETAFGILAEYAEAHEPSSRADKIVKLVLNRSRSLIMDTGVQLAVKRLLNKGIRKTDPQLAIDLQKKIDASLSNLLEGMSFHELVDKDVTTSNTMSLSADEFLSINPETLASQIHIFHKKFLSVWSPTADMALLMMSPLSQNKSRNPLMFTTNSVHFLTEHILTHILSPEISSARRAAILSSWIDIGQYLQERGDMVGWFAITMAVLSPAVLRLRHTWDLLDLEKLDVVEREWAPVMLDLERRKFEVDKAEAVRPSVMAPGGVGKLMPFEDVVPYFGDLSLCMSEVHQSSGRSVDCQKIIDGLDAMEAGLERWKRYPLGTGARDPPASMAKINSAIPSFQKCLLSMNARHQNPSSIYSQALFDTSLSCEPLSTGTYLHSHYHQTLPLSTGANIPLLLTDVVVRFALFNRKDTEKIGDSLKGKVSANSTGGGVNDSSLNVSKASKDMLAPNADPNAPHLRRTRSFPPTRDATHTTGYDRFDLNTRERTAGLHSDNQDMLRTIRDVTGVDQKVYHSQDGELILKGDSGDTSLSRPSSVIESMSKRTSTTSKRPISGSEGVQSPSHGAVDDKNKNKISILDVVAKGGTLERLVDILALGVEPFSSRVTGTNKDSSLRLSMDMDMYRTTFLATFRSYCSPIVLLDYLRKRLVGSRSAALLNSSNNDDIVFPDWTGIDTSREEAIDWYLVAKIHIGILEVLKSWVDDFFVDFHSDLLMRESFLTFLMVAAKELAIWDTHSPEDQKLQNCADHIENLFEDVRETFERQSFRADQTVVPRAIRSAGILSLPIKCQIGALEEFVDKLEGSLSHHFQCVSLLDWMVSMEVLENQASEQTGFLIPRLVAQACEDDDVIQDIFFLMSKLQRHGTNESLLAGLPKSLQDLLAMRNSMVNWLLSQVVDSDITVEERANRILSLLKCMSLCQSRMSTMDIYDKQEGGEKGRRQQVPSFITSAISTALVRPESRAFSYAWTIAAELSTGTKRATIDTLEEILPEVKQESLRSSAPMTPCPGWLIERMLEIVCMVPNMLVENSRLINFDKRRYVYNLVSNFVTFEIEENTDNATTDVKIYQFDQQAQLQILPTFQTMDIHRVDKRVWRDIAGRENLPLKANKVRVFQKLIAQEHEKHRRDNKLREIIERQHKEQLRTISRRNPALKVDLGPEKKGGRRLGVTNLFKAVRPISMAFGSSWTPPQAGRLVSPFDLPHPRSVEFRNKPSIAIDLAHVVGLSYPGAMREKFMWKIRSDDGTSYIIQSTCDDDAEEWLRLISSFRGVGYSVEGNESVDNVAAMVPVTKGVQPSFGVPIEELCRRDNAKIPLVVEQMLSEIEHRGLDEVGIYRIPGSVNSISLLKTALDTEPGVRMDDDRWYDINAVAGCFKMFVREIPHPLVPPELLNDFKEIARESNEECRVEFYSCLVLQLPAHCYNFLRRMYLHLHMISNNSDINKMTSVNLAIVFGMGMAPEVSTGFGINPDLGLYQAMVRTWITFAPTIFPDIDEEESVERFEVPPVPPTPASASSAAPTPTSATGLNIPRLGRPPSMRFGTDSSGNPTIDFS